MSFVCVGSESQTATQLLLTAPYKRDTRQHGHKKRSTKTLFEKKHTRNQKQAQHAQYDQNYKAA